VGPLETVIATLGMTVVEEKLYEANRERRLQKAIRQARRVSRHSADHS